MSSTNDGLLADLVESIWTKQQDGWKNNCLEPAESFLEKHPELNRHPHFAVDIIFNEFAIRQIAGTTADLQQELLIRFPQWEELLRRQFQVYQAIEDLEANVAEEPADASGWTDLGTGDPDPPETIANRFQIRREVGRGATARVFEAWDSQLLQKVAIKCPLTGCHAPRKVRQRLIQEAQALARLHHPSIVPIRETGLQDGHLYLVSPLINGPNLQQLAMEQKIEVKQIAQWGQQIAEALSYAHSLHIIHRDVKPANIVIDPYGRAMLTDFGLATQTGQLLSITQSGEVLGTPAYMAPEQLAPALEPDQQCDIYSLGATLFHLLAGRPPFEGSLASVVHQLMECDAPPLHSIRPEVPSDLAAIVAKCLHREKDRRYPTARDLADDLNRFRMGEWVQARNSGVWERGIVFARRNPIPLAVGACLLVLLAFLSGVIWQLGNVARQRDRAMEAENRNAQLLAELSSDAGTMSRQQGDFGAALQHYQMAVRLTRQIPGGSPEYLCDIHLRSLQCHLLLGQRDAAVEQWQLAKEISDSLTTRFSQIQYWRMELEAHGAQLPVTQFQWDEEALADLSPAQQSFLLGMQAESSALALRYFQQASEEDPFHYGARRMGLIMAFSLARFREVREEVAIARKLFPDDLDFQLLAALNESCLGENAATDSILENCPLTETERLRWKRFGEFLAGVTQPSHRKFSTDLESVQEYLVKYLEQFHPLLVERHWRFPPRIGQNFLDLTESFQQFDDPKLVKEQCRKLARIHPEGTLLSVAADTELSGTQSINPVQDLIRSRDRYLEAIHAPAFAHGHIQNCWMGVFGNSVALALIHQHQVKQNQDYYLEAAQQLSLDSERVQRQFRVLSISMIRAQRWDLAQRFIEAWNGSPSAGSTIDAKWHLGLLYQYRKDWLKQWEIANQVLLESESELDSDSRQAWQGLRDQALNKLRQQLGQDIVLTPQKTDPNSDDSQ